MALRVAPADWDDRVRALAHRLDVDAAVDLRVFRVGLDETAVGADAALGLGAGIGYDRTEEVRDLMRAWSLRSGRRRCRNARTAFRRNRRARQAYL